MRRILLATVFAAIGCNGMVGTDEAYELDGLAAQATVSRPAGQGILLRTSLPASAKTCRQLGGSSCTDADHDGLTDAWENLALVSLRPLVRLDEGEKLLTVASATGMVGRAAPVTGGIRLFIMVGYDRDYGSYFGISKHDGDSERVAIELAPAGGPGDYQVVRTYTAAHEGESGDNSEVHWDPGALTYATVGGVPRWLVYSSQNKHATYASASVCESYPLEDCDGGGSRLMPIWNAGEDGAPLVGDLGNLGFPNEDPWAYQRFCGGHYHADRSSCASAVREKLINDPF